MSVMQMHLQLFQPFISYISNKLGKISSRELRYKCHLETYNEWQSLEHSTTYIGLIVRLGLYVHGNAFWQL